MKLKSNLDAIIYEEIVNSLIRGEYSMGQTVLIDELAKKYEVSRTPVTQAVKLLVNDGLLVSLKNGKVKVPIFDEVQMRKICEVRHIMEAYAIEKILKTVRPDDDFYKQLEANATTGIEALKEGDKLKFNRADLVFHKKLIAGADNEFLSAEYARIQGEFIVANYLIIPLEERDFARAAQNHIDIVKIMKTNDLKGSLEMIEKHIFGISASFLS